MSQPVEPPTQPLVVDTDAGIDDAVGLWWALEHQRVDVVAVVASAGNVPRDVAAANVGRILRAAGRTDVPVAVGAGAGAPRPIGLGEGPPAGAVPGSAPDRVPAPARNWAPHGADGLGGCAGRWPLSEVGPVAEPASGLLVQLTSERPGEIDVVTLGPLTTLAEALRVDPGLAARVRTLTVMGGQLGPSRHSVIATGANIGRDPEAAARVLAAPWAGTEPPLLVALDVTRQTLLGPDELALAAAGRTPAARFVAEPLRRYARYYRDAGIVPRGAVPCHDLLAVVAAVEPEVITAAPRRRPRVEGLPGPAGVPWRVAEAADGARLRAALRSLVGGPAPTSG